ncbi:DUF1801 domain-containing protein [Algoriphagus aestuarii]|nr:DUF1801 domain-containing protein [Algoriphagus aestuarii]
MELKETDAFYYKQNEPIRTCFLALRSLILAQHEAISETVKYGMPCFCIQKKPMIYLWKDKVSDEPYLLFVHGQLMTHPKLESGTRAKMKIFRVNPSSDLPKGLLEELLQKAISIQQTHLKK